MADTPPATPPPSLPPNISVEEEYTPSYDAENGASTVLNFRTQIPIKSRRPYLIRFKLPVVTSAPANAVTGAGDLSVFGLTVAGTERQTRLIGFTVRVPLAHDNSLGSGKYSIGPAYGYQNRIGPWTIGFFTQSFFSVIGPSSRATVGQSKIEPILSYSFQDGWSVGLSTMSMTYNWVRNQWTEVPFGFGVDKRLGASLQASLESETNLVTAKFAPSWTIRGLLKWQWRQ